MKRPRRRAFTLVELLVVIAILAVLIALLLPAIQQVRQAVMRSQCANHLRQIGIAIEQYQSSQDGYPLVMTDGAGSNGQGGCLSGFFGWHVRILPYLDQDPIYREVNFDLGMGAVCKNDTFKGSGRIESTHPNATVAARRIGVFLCPADSGSRIPIGTMGSGMPAPGSYSANLGWPSAATGIAGERYLATDPQTGEKFAEYVGVFSLANPHPNVAVPWHPRRAIRPADIEDGHTRTAFVAERRIQTISDSRKLAQDKLFQCMNSDSEPRTLPELAVTSQNPNVDATAAFYAPYIGRSWITGWTLAGNTYMHVFGPNSISASMHGGENDGNMLYSASSRHAGGANVLFGDNSVHFISESIDLTAWWMLGNRSDGSTSNPP